MFKKINLNMHQVLGIFILLGGFLLLSSKRMTQSILHTMIGRLFLVSCVILFSHHSMILGICSVLLILWLTQNSAKSFVIEGMTDPTLTANATLTADQQATLDDKKKELQDVVKTKDIGVNKEAIQATLQAKPSNELPVPSSSSTDDVSPNTNVESFTNKYSFL
jgi:hypothetical protein